MKNIVILILGLTTIPVLPVLAQTSPGQSVPTPSVSQTGQSPNNTQDDFNYIKAEIGRLLIENKRLEAEFQALRNQVDELKSKALEKERQMEKAPPEDWTEDRTKQKEMNALKAVYGGTEKLRNEIMVKKGRTAFLSTQLLDLEEKQRPWKLKLSDLEFFKRELELDIQLIHYELDARDQDRQDAINKIQDKIQENLMRERELLGLITAIEDGTMYDSEKMIALIEENEALALKALNLSHEAQFQMRENDILQNKKVLLSQSKGAIQAQKRQRKEELQRDVDYLKKQVDELHSSLDQSLQEKSHREEVLKDFVHLQQENDKLRQQIAEINSQLNASPL